MASFRRTCQRTVSSSLMWDVGTSGHRTFTRVPCHGQSQIGDRSFMAAGPRLWNSLPIEIRWKGITFEHYRRRLKAYLFVCAAAHCDLVYLSAPDMSARNHSYSCTLQRNRTFALSWKIVYSPAVFNCSVVSTDEMGFNSHW